MVELLLIWAAVARMWRHSNEVTRTTRTPAFLGYPRRPMITHTIDQFILNPKSILLTSSYQIPSQNKMKAKKLEKFAKLKF